MRKKGLAVVALTLLLVVGLMATAIPASAATVVKPLWAGQAKTDSTVTVWDDGTYLYVKYDTVGGWMLTETHVAVASSLDGIPQTKKGNPIPGQFPFGTEHDPAVNTYTYVIPLDSLSGWIFIAAHAVVVNGCQEETAWAGCQNEFPGKKWSRYFKYQVI